MTDELAPQQQPDQMPQQRPDRESSAPLPRSEGISKLATALAAASGEIGVVPKSGFNPFDNYRYSTDADIAYATRGAMAKHGLSLVPLSIELKTHTTSTQKGGTQTWFTIHRRYLLAHSSGEWMHLDGIGIATDRGDKGLYKAETGCLKYVLKGLFNLSCGDDPETASPEGAPPNGHGKKQESKQQNPEQSTGDAWKDAQPVKGGKQLSKTAISGLQKIAQGNGINNLDEVLTLTLACSTSDLTQGRCYQAVRHLIENGGLLRRAQQQRSNAA